MKKGGIGIQKPKLGNGLAYGKIQPIGFTVQHILLELYQGQVVIILKDQIRNISPVIPVVDIEKELAIEGIVKVEIVVEARKQSWVPFFKIVFIEKEPERIEVIVFGSVHISSIIKGKTVLF